jgi:hypothetical protein
MSTVFEVKPEMTGARVPMSQIDLSVVAAITLGAMVVGPVVGFATGNLQFAFLMFGLPLIGFMIFAIIDDQLKLSTRPVGGSQSVTLPIIALVVNCLGVPFVGIALGHASRYLIRKQGGEGEKIALVGLIVGYLFLFVQASFGLWLVSSLGQLLNVAGN